MTCLGTLLGENMYARLSRQKLKTVVRRLSKVHRSLFRFTLLLIFALEIVAAFRGKLLHVSWMDEESAKAARKKAEDIIIKVGYPLTPDTLDAHSLAAWYARLEIKADDFFGNVLRSTLFETYRVWQTLGKRRDRQTWAMNPQVVNAYYCLSIFVHHQLA